MRDFFVNKWSPHGKEICFTASPNEYDTFKLFQGELVHPDPFPLKISRGTRYYDIAYFYDDPVNFCISERLRDLMLEGGLTGWKTYDVSIENFNEKYYGMVITSVAGPIIEPDFRGFVKGLEFDLSTWDGSDLFRLSNFAGPIFNQKLVDILDSLKAKNVKIFNTRDIERYSIGRK